MEKVQPGRAAAENCVAFTWHLLVAFANSEAWCYARTYFRTGTPSGLGDPNSRFFFTLRHGDYN